MSLSDRAESTASDRHAYEPVRGSLRHTPFFAALATLAGHEGQSEWRALLAGLVTLRLADRRFGGPEGRVMPVPRDTIRAGLVPVPQDVIDAARAAVRDVDDREAVAAPLRGLFQSASGATVSDIPQRLLAYGNALQTDARWPLAADVYRTVLRFGDSMGPRGYSAIRPFLPHVYDRLGRSLRMMGDVDKASAAYRAGRDAARINGDIHAEQLIRISEAKILMHLGNLPAAAAALDAIIRDATPISARSPALLSTPADGLAVVLVNGASDQLNVPALAHHDRAVVASRMRDFNLAAEQYYAAWRGYRDPGLREAACADFAESLVEMGHFDAARDALMLLSAGAQRPEVRLLAATNLLELAVLDQQEGAFNTFRRTLRDASLAGTLPAEVAAKFALYEGQGEIRFGRPECAAEAFERALTLGIRHRVHEVTIRADHALADLKAGRPAADWFPVVAKAAISPSVERITRAVHRARRRAGVRRHG
jgi:tetratricopeptide (TPR) repeat protein